jgi:tetratricopeptide (TPR) repeat protein
MQKLRVFILLCVITLLTAPAQSATLDDTFDQATSAETHGQFREAMAGYQKVIEASAKTNEDAWAARSKARIARLLVNKGLIKEAEPLYLQSLKLTQAQFRKDPELMVDLDDLAESYTAQSKKLPDAKECLFHALALRLVVDPHHPNVNQSYRQIALYMLGRGDRAAAERYIKQGIELEKNCPPSKLYRLVQDQGLLASIYMQSNDWVKAEQTTRELLTQAEKYPFLSWAWPQLHCTLGQCHSQRYQYEESDREYQLALTLAKKYPNPNGDISPECVKGLKENAILKLKNKSKVKKAVIAKH